MTRYGLPCSSFYAESSLAIKSLKVDFVWVEAGAAAGCAGTAGYVPIKKQYGIVCGRILSCHIFVH